MNWEMLWSKIRKLEQNSGGGSSGGIFKFEPTALGIPINQETFTPTAGQYEVSEELTAPILEAIEKGSSLYCAYSFDMMGTPVAIEAICNYRMFADGGVLCYFNFGGAVMTIAFAPGYVEITEVST